MAATDSTWGIPKPVRTVLAARITELRVGLQEDARRQLAAWGIGAEQVSPPPGGRVLSADDAGARDVVLAVLETRHQAGVPRSEAFQGYVEEVAFTLLDRLVTFRCLEERDLLLVDGRTETLVRRETVRGTSSLIWRTRDVNAGLDERSIARTAYHTACAAITARVKVLFDPDDEASALFPTLPLWQKAVDALNDPAIPSAVFAEDEIMGWVYQYWSTELKNAVYAKLAKGGKIEDPKELAAATSLYTERYIVDYLVQNTLGATWTEMHPESGLPATWPYYVKPPAGNPPVERELKRVRELTLIDPCVGSGHFLVRAFDLFAQLYAEEGIEQPEDVAGLILERNLYGADIDRRAVQIAALALYVKGCALAGADFRPRKLNLVACDIAIPPAPPAEFLESLDEPELKDLARSLWSGLAGIRTFGSLLHPERSVNEAFAKLKAQGKGTLWADDIDWEKRQDHFRNGLRQAFTAAAGDIDLSTRLFGEEASRGLDALQILGRRYDVVVTNPPYAGSGALDRDFRDFLKANYPLAKRDLYSAFMVRCDLFGAVDASIGLLTQQSWMFLPSFAELRTRLLSESTVWHVAQLGEHAFEEASAAGAFVAALTYVKRTPLEGHRMVGIRAVAFRTPAEKEQVLREVRGRAKRQVFEPEQQGLLLIPKTPIVYWLADSFFALLRSPGRLLHEAELREGPCTGDDNQFLRLFWETRSQRWVPFPKGGGFRRWAGLCDYTLDWAPEGRHIKSFPGSIIPNESFYFAEGLCYTEAARGSLALRLHPEGRIPGNKAPGVYRRDGSNFALMAVLNGRAATYLMRVLTPVLNFDVGMLRSLPMPVRFPATGKLHHLGLCCVALKLGVIARLPLEREFTSVVVEHPLGDSTLPLLHALEGWNERLVFDAYELGPEDVQAVIDETGIPAGWNPLIVGHDRLPEAPDGIEIPAGLTEFLATLEHRELSASDLAKTKARLRTMYEAGRGAKEEVEAQPAKGDDEEEGAALGALIPIPTETFLEELAVKTELHPITVHWLLEELKAEGVVSPPLRKAELEEYVDITLVRMLGYRWPEQDAYEATHGPILDADLVDADGIIPLVPCGDEPVAEERVRTRLVRQLGDDGADAFLADLRRFTKRDLGDWIRKDFFKAHTKRFKNRPIAWHLRSPEGAFEAIVLYHCLSRETLAKLRVTYAGDRLGRLRADQQRAKEANDTRTVTDLQVAIEDVEAFRATLAAIEQGSELQHRIRCRWKDETDTGRPGPYAPDIDDGVKVNIRPFQETALLPVKVISKW